MKIFVFFISMLAILFWGVFAVVFLGFFALPMVLPETASIEQAGYIALEDADREQKEQILYDIVEEGFRNKVGLYDKEEYIDITKFGFSAEENGEGREFLARIRERVLYDHPEFFYVSPQYEIWRTEDNSLLAMTPHYYDFAQDEELLNHMNQEIENEINLAMGQIEGVSDPVEIALILHDYLVLHCGYNWETAIDVDEEQIPETASNLYGALVLKDASCQGYSLAYKALLDRAGIECKVVSGVAQLDGKEENHSWNMLKIGEHWYHTDVTWDDPTPDLKGYCDHQYFLLSDDTMKAEHITWDNELLEKELPVCDDTTYESDAIFCDVEYPIYKKEENLYYIKQNEDETATLYCGKISEQGTALAQISIPWYAVGIVWANDCLYYTDDWNQFMCYNLSTGQNHFIADIPFVMQPSQDGYYSQYYDTIGLERQNNDIVAFSRTTRQELYRYHIA